MMRMTFGAFALMALGGCQEQPDPLAEMQKSVKPPQQVCAQAQEALAKLSTEGGLEIDGKGGATMMEEAWLRLPGDGRDQVVKLLAFGAACRAPEATTEQRVVIRSEYGRVMLDQIVETTANLSELTQE